MDYPIYVGGEFQTSDVKLPVVNPYTNEVFAHTFFANELQVKTAIEKAEKSQKSLHQLPSYKRYEILFEISEAIRKQRKHLAELITKECGKPVKYSLGEVDRAVQTFLIAAEESKRLPKEYLSLDWTPGGEGKEGLVKSFPVGIVAGYTPFNFPLNLVAHKVAPAIAAGCPVIIKPSPKTPLSAIELAKIIHQTDLPEGAFSVLPLKNENADWITLNPKISMLSFTGSAQVGFQLKRRTYAKKVLLELGGNAGVVVTENCDLAHAVNRCLVGGFAYSGQVCIHTQRVYVEESVFDFFTEQFLIKVQSLKAGNPLSEDTDISTMIDVENANRIDAWIKEAVEGGAKILAGGEKNKAYYAPTVLTNTKPSMKVCCEEIFGPVVIIEKYQSFKKVTEEVNNSPYGLQAGVFTNDLNYIKYAFENLQVGGVIINDVPTFRVDHMPYGGVKNSGIGREGVKYAIEEMTEKKLLVF